MNFTKENSGYICHRCFYIAFNKNDMYRHCNKKKMCEASYNCVYNNTEYKRLSIEKRYIFTQKNFSLSMLSTRRLTILVTEYHDKLNIIPNISRLKFRNQNPVVPIEKPLLDLFHQIDPEDHNEHHIDNDLCNDSLFMSKQTSDGLQSQSASKDNMDTTRLGDLRSPASSRESSTFLGARRAPEVYFDMSRESSSKNVNDSILIPQEISDDGQNSDKVNSLQSLFQRMSQHTFNNLKLSKKVTDSLLMSNLKETGLDRLTTTRLDDQRSAASSRELSILTLQGEVQSSKDMSTVGSDQSSSRNIDYLPKSSSGFFDSVGGSLYQALVNASSITGNDMYDSDEEDEYDGPEPFLAQYTNSQSDELNCARIEGQKYSSDPKRVNMILTKDSKVSTTPSIQGSKPIITEDDYICYVDGERRFKCMRCMSIYKRKESLIKHLKNKKSCDEKYMFTQRMIRNKEEESMGKGICFGASAGASTGASTGTKDRCGPVQNILNIQHNSNNNNIQNISNCKLVVSDFIEHKYAHNHIPAKFIEKDDFYLLKNFLNAIMVNQKNRNIYFEGKYAFFYADGCLKRIPADKAGYIILEKIRDCIEYYIRQNPLRKKPSEEYVYVYIYYEVMAKKYKFDTLYRPYVHKTQSYIPCETANIRTRDTHLSEMTQVVNAYKDLTRDIMTELGCYQIEIDTNYNVNIPDYASSRKRNKEFIDANPY